MLGTQRPAPPAPPPLSDAPAANYADIDGDWQTQFFADNGPILAVNPGCRLFCLSLLLFVIRISVPPCHTSREPQFPLVPL